MEDDFAARYRAVCDEREAARRSAVSGLTPLQEYRRMRAARALDARHG